MSPPYYDSNIYMQSANLVVKVAYLYYYKHMRQSDIASQLEISVPTVSRLLKKAKEQEVVRFTIDQRLLECLEMEDHLRGRFRLREVIVAPLQGDVQKMKLEDLKKTVALEGARYLQRIVTEHDKLGVAWGETVWYVYNYLNPSQRINMEFVTLHGFLNHAASKLDSSWLVPRIAKAFGGKSYSIDYKGFQSRKSDVIQIMQDENVRRAFDQFPYLTLSVSGVGMFYPEPQSILATGHYLSDSAMEQLRQAGVYGDLIFRFFDQNGNECDTDMRYQCIGIPWEIYKRIPNKIIVAAGEKKKDVIIALLRGRLVDTLIIDESLARSICRSLD